MFNKSKKHKNHIEANTWNGSRRKSLSVRIPLFFVSGLAFMVLAVMGVVSIRFHRSRVDQYIRLPV